MNAVHSVSLATNTSVLPLLRASPDEVGLSPQRLERIGAVLDGDITRGQLPGAVVALAVAGGWPPKPE